MVGRMEEDCEAIRDQLELSSSQKEEMRNSRIGFGSKDEEEEGATNSQSISSSRWCGGQIALEYSQE